MIKKRAISFLLTVLVISLTACSPESSVERGDDPGSIESREETVSAVSEKEKTKTTNRIVMPYNTAYYIGSEWNIDTITDHFKELGFTNICAIPCDPNDEKYEYNIFAMSIETGLWGTDPWDAGDEFRPDAEISIYYNEFPLLTADNCPDLATILTSKDMDYMSFCEKYDGRYLEFDAHVVGHLVYMGGTSHIIDVAGGDYDGHTELDAHDPSTYAGLIIRIGDRTWGHSIDDSVEVGNPVIVSGRVDMSQSKYFECLYVETMNLSIR